MTFGLSVDNLSCVRGGRRVFAGASFRVAAGSAARLIGPNGAGKSTLLRAIAGLIDAAGAVRWREASSDASTDPSRDASLAGDREALQERIAYIGHLDAVKPSLTVAENLSFWAGMLGGAADRARIGAALERFDLSAIADAPAAYCSAGQKRRLGLARLCVWDRPLWLLDEPTVSLDAASVAVFADLVADHCAGGGAAVIATHIDLGLAAAQTIDMADFAPGAADDGDAAALDPFLDPSLSEGGAP